MIRFDNIYIYYIIRFSLIDSLLYIHPCISIQQHKCIDTQKDTFEQQQQQQQQQFRKHYIHLFIYLLTFYHCINDCINPIMYVRIFCKKCYIIITIFIIMIIEFYHLHRPIHYLKDIYTFLK